MKFFVIILLSSFHGWSLVYPDDAQGILEPSHLLYYQYSIPRSQLPKNVFPNTSCQVLGIPVAKVLKTFPSISSPIGLLQAKENTQYACEYDPYLQPPLRCEHFHYCKFGLEYLDNEFANHLLKHDNGTLLPKLYGNSSDLLYVNSFYILPYNKTKTFIETKVSAMELQGFNH